MIGEVWRGEKGRRTKGPTAGYSVDILWHKMVEALRVKSFCCEREQAFNKIRVTPVKAPRKEVILDSAEPRSPSMYEIR